VPAPWNQRWVPAAAIFGLALAASLAGITNQFAQDDFGFVLRNDAVHDLSRGLHLFLEPYVGPPRPPEHYRPLALLSLAVQWAAGAGEPVIFRLVSYLLYAATGLAVFRLARTALPAAPAFAAAALFAVHPVHVEAVALAVNQGELWVALLSCLAVVWYVEVRRAGPLRLRSTLGIAALYFTACLFKEHAAILPGLLLASELFLIPGGHGFMGRVRSVSPLYLVLLLTGLTFLAIRTAVLGGDVRGALLADAMAPLSIGERALTMLTVVPHWFRLLFWPADLQGDYSPSEIVAQESWGADATLGLLLILAATVTAVACRRRAPAIAFGIFWLAVALLPVHNVLVPTGVVLAERTLFLPSIGAMLVLGGLGSLVLERATGSTRVLLGSATGLLLVLGAYRSAIRHPDWSDMFNYWYVTANRDAPASFRAHHALGEMYLLAGAYGLAEQEFRMSMALAPPHVSDVYLAYADMLRRRGFCDPAVELYRKSLGISPQVHAVRLSLIACLIQLGRYPDALQEIGKGIPLGEHTGAWLRLRAAADSALKSGAPPGTVRVPLP
jgi:tetratricopeptide (TPR) repeat protein